MLDQNATTIATYALSREGIYLDRRDWKQWIDLYEEKAVYWIPAWRDEGQETADPDAEVSLIYHDSRTGLEDRVMRIMSRKSITSMPLPRTAHFVSNVIGMETGDGIIDAQASWVVHVYQPRTAKQHMHFGRYEVQLKRHGQDWRIARKTTHLQNDRVATVIDFYTV